MAELRKKVIYYVATSLDGFIATSSGSVDWLNNIALVDDGYTNFIKTVDTVVMGRATYDQVIGFDCEYPYKDQKSYVFTSKPAEAVHDTVTIVSDPLEKSLPGLLKVPEGTKAEDVKNVWIVGGANFAASCLEKKLVDEVHINVMPIVLGTGINLFGELSKNFKLNHMSTRTTSGDVKAVEILYSVAYDQDA